MAVYAACRVECSPTAQSRTQVGNRFLLSEPVCLDKPGIFGRTLGRFAASFIPRRCNNGSRPRARNDDVRLLKFPVGPCNSINRHPEMARQGAHRG